MKTLWIERRAHSSGFMTSRHSVRPLRKSRTVLERYSRHPGSVPIQPGSSGFVATVSCNTWFELSRELSWRLARDAYSPNRSQPFLKLAIGGLLDLRCP